MDALEIALGPKFLVPHRAKVRDPRFARERIEDITGQHATRAIAIRERVIVAASRSRQ